MQSAKDCTEFIGGGSSLKVGGATLEELFKGYSYTLHFSFVKVREL